MKSYQFCSSTVRKGCGPRESNDGELELTAYRDVTLFTDRVFESQLNWQLHTADVAYEERLF